MVAQALDIARETYLAFLMDRTCSGPVIVGSPMGGMDIEEVAEKHPDAIHKVCRHHRVFVVTGTSSGALKLCLFFLSDSLFMSLVIHY